MANFRSPPLLRLARGQDCTLQIPSVCNGNAETVVSAHSNWHDKGMSIKASDCYIAWACSACHHAVDQGSKLNRAERQHYWQRGFERTLKAMWEQGMLRVAR